MPMRPPFKENALFRDLRNALWRYNACVGNNGGPYDLFDYAHGYFQATKMLLAEARKPEATIDLVVYPICLTYRHAIELYIKYLITDLAEATKQATKFRTNHSLKENWLVARKLIKDARLKATDAQIAAMTEVVDAITEVDPRGETFRYPESIKGDQHLKDWASINLIVIERSYEHIFEIARTWHYRIEDILQG